MHKLLKNTIVMNSVWSITLYTVLNVFLFTMAENLMVELMDTVFRFTEHMEMVWFRMRLYILLCYILKYF